MTVHFFKMAALCRALLSTLVLSGSLTVLAADIAVPSNINFKRLQLLEKPQGDHKDGLLKVYVVIKGEALDGKLLVSSAKYLQNVTMGNLRQLLLNKIHETNRFEVFDQQISETFDESSILIEGKVVGATQHIENMVVARKAITRIRLSVVINDMGSGKVLRAKTFTGHYGSEAGEGTVITSDAEMRSEHLQESLFKDYERALHSALDDVAAYVETKYRPVGKVIELKGDALAMDGGELQGFRGDDEVVVFRTRFTNLNGERTPGIMSGVARAKCITVTERSSTCRLISTGGEGPVQSGDYVVVADESLGR
jgi:hypothetical protein